MLSTVISQVFSARGPLESESSLDHAAAQLVESHVRGLVGFGYNGVVGESHRSGIIGLDGILPLGPFHVYESLEQRYHVLVSDKKSGKFSRSGRGHDKLDYLGNGENGSILTWFGILLGEEYVCFGAAA